LLRLLCRDPRDDTVQTLVVDDGTMIELPVAIRMGCWKFLRR
jgi:hypothetical protein